MGAAKENERRPCVFVRSLEIHRITLSEEEHKFHMGVYTESKSDKQIGDKIKKKEWPITGRLHSLRALMGSQCRDI